jgi:diadenylate cyclase
VPYLSTDVSDFVKMLIEVSVFAIGIYTVLRFLRETRGSGVIRGLTLMFLIGFTAFLLLIQVGGLSRLGFVFDKIVQGLVLGLIVVFQPEIRRGIVHLGDAPIFGRFLKRETRTLQRLLRSVARLSKDRIGALIAIEREGSLANLADTGITIDAELNSYLIESIFYPGTALHDGAIIIRDDRIVAASCLLPLSQNPDLDKSLGTRHRAGLGLSEETDALAIVVSEETGKVSAMLGGTLMYDLSLEQLEATIEDSLGLRRGGRP